jgi:hypothetical protein
MIDDGTETVTGIEAPAPETKQQDTTPLVATDGNFSENWRSALPEDIRENPSLTHYKNLGGMAKSLISAQKMVGLDKGRVAVVPDKHSTDEEREDFYRKTGRPETAADYGIKPPENLPDGVTFNPAMIEGLQQKAFELGIPQDKLAGLWSHYVESELTKHNEQTALEQHGFNEAAAALKTEWGYAFDQRLQTANDAVRTFGLSETLEKLGIANHPEVVKAFYQIGAKVGEDKLIGASPKMAPADARSRIEEIHAMPEYYDPNDPRQPILQKEITDLYVLTEPPEQTAPVSWG